VQSGTSIAHQENATRHTNQPTAPYKQFYATNNQLEKTFKKH
jgi:hypothetical protein